MKLLIIVTSPTYELWGMTEKDSWHDDDVLSETEVRATDVDKNKIIVLRQAALPSGVDDESEVRQKTTDWVTEIANCPKYGADVKVHIAAHSNYVDLKSVRARVDKARLTACAFFSHMVDAAGLDEVSDALYQLLPKPHYEAFETALEAVKNRQVVTHAQRLSTLKHRLAHLFLPISVDLQAWSGYDFDDEYMKEILSSYGDEEERLERARGLLYGDGQPAESENVEKIVADADLDYSETWEKVQTLLPRDEPESDADKNASVAYSEVFQELDVLGSLKDKTKLKRLRNSLQSGRNPFNEWYAGLDGALIELRNEMNEAE